jgi:hypothetical protein
MVPFIQEPDLLRGEKSRLKLVEIQGWWPGGKPNQLQPGLVAHTEGRPALAQRLLISLFQMHENSANC